MLFMEKNKDKNTLYVSFFGVSEPSNGALLFLISLTLSNQF